MPLRELLTPSSSSRGQPSASKTALLVLTTRTFVPDTGMVKGSEFVRKIQKLGRKRDVAVRWVAERGTGSHGTL